MKRLILVSVYLLVNSCATPVTAKLWAECEDVCKDRKGVMEACVEYFKGPGCHCNDDKIIWLDERK
ncbi:hypothetical protein [Pseudobacteriovorax antillogorgiicola]|uniref:Uncharacterized protein n=1 Tax=Pseudobacteriovorax antillogorgiicola TaxID=1513793 RepID=A0A1Y6CJ24_9BACT|nr:hypothetical protein [Pseudobacteriovorax antillogorgiicola]TCS47026.1 hypothetical protein EDD56_122121 [Pseudobacteriovorax antillogorgiicola]SMF65247.1 hypothetical protein SAMN06296036_122121 [Pseudobacteriovorax antillogorgiicola]